MKRCGRMEMSGRAAGFRRLKERWDEKQMTPTNRLSGFGTGLATNSSSFERVPQGQCEQYAVLTIVLIHLFCVAWLLDPQPNDGQGLGHLDSRARRPALPLISQTLPPSGGKPRRLLIQVKVSAQLSWAHQVASELVMACPNSHEHSPFHDGLDRRDGCVDTRLEGWADESGHRLASLSWCGDGDEWTPQLMRLDQYDDPVGHQKLPRSLEGMDHALGCDSSKRPAEDCNLEWPGVGTKSLG
jgi:hypothetical protein